MTERLTVSRFQVADENGMQITVIEYRVYSESNEVPGGRASREPTLETWFETPDGRLVEKMSEFVFSISGYDQSFRMT